jgi:DNA-binding MarR family transcriptional regulator
MSREEHVLAGIDLLRRNQVLNQMLDEAAAEYLGVNTTDARAIDVVHQAGRITAGDLARELRLSTGAVTTIVDRLERAGYARRISDPDDRRRVLVEVTPAVRKVSEEIFGSPEDAISWAEPFTDKELEVLLRFHRLTRQWLEGRLAHMEQLLERRRPRRGMKRMRGRGRA